MRIVVVGLGQTGKELAKEFIKVGHEVIVIDVNKAEIESFTNEYDAIGIVGSGASKEIQVKAKSNNADVLVAVSPNDEVNIMSCITAKLLGTKHTIARVNATEYLKDEGYLTKEIGIDLIINSEYDTATEITRLVSYPSNVKTGAFANGKVDVTEIIVKEDSPLINLSLSKLKEKYEKNILVASIIRNDKLIIPRGDITIKQGDTINVIAKNTDIYRFLKKLDLINKPIRSVLIVGCGKIGEYLIKNLYTMKMKIKLIEFDKNRCVELSEKFPDVTIVHASTLDPDMLIEEGIKDYECVISLTDKDETNLVVTLFAWSCKIKKLITKITSLSYLKMMHNVEIDNTLSPHFTVLSSVHRFIRGIDKKSTEGDEKIKSLYRFANNMAEAIELEVGEKFLEIGKSLKELKIKNNIVVAFIIRDNSVIIPNGDTTLENKDRIVVIAEASKNISDISEILE